MDSNKRNYALEGYRWFFTLVVAQFHFKAFQGWEPSEWKFSGGYLAVEFFFVLSGFFLMKSYEERSRLSEPAAGMAAKFFAWRYCRLFPQYAMSFVMMGALSQYNYNDISVETAFKQGAWEFFMLEQTGLGTNVKVNATAWFVSALLISSFLLVVCLLLFKDWYVFVIAPLSIFAIYSFFYHKFHCLSDMWTMMFFCSGVWRAFAGTSIGCISWRVCKQASKIVGKKNLFIKAFATVLEGFILLLYMVYAQKGHKEYDFIFPFLFGVLIISVYLAQSYLTMLLNRKVFGVLGGLSYAVYLNARVFQEPIMRLYRGKLPYWPVFFSVMLAIHLFSIFTHSVSKKATAGMEKGLHLFLSK